jgi:hypothetical protein
MLEWVTVETVQSEQQRGARFGCPAGTDYYTRIVQRATWPQDGSIYAGITYERNTVWIGPEKGMKHVQVSSSQYPAKGN